MTTFIGMLEAQWAEGKHVCVGLDPVEAKLPADLRALATRAGGQRGHYTGNYMAAMLRVVQATKHIAACYKPNWAFFLSRGHQGLLQLEHLVQTIKEETGIPVILDCKAGDIGETNNHYAEAAFDVVGADAITIHPYLGWEANRPFLDRTDRGIIVLCRTSNQGGGEFQDVRVEYPDEDWEVENRRNTMNARSKTKPLYIKVAENISDSETWNQNGNCCLVTGGTYPGEIGEIRKVAPNIPVLIPGIGKQGGDLEASVRAARHRFLINSSSGIIFADDPRAETEKLNDQIQQVLATLG